jgi:hypothetical protein
VGEGVHDAADGGQQVAAQVAGIRLARRGQCGIEGLDDQGRLGRPPLVHGCLSDTGAGRDSLDRERPVTDLGEQGGGRTQDGPVRACAASDRWPEVRRPIAYPFTHSCRWLLHMV